MFFDKQPELDICHVQRHLHVNVTPLTVEDRLLIKTLQTEKGWTVERNYYWVSSKTLETAYAVWSLTNNWVYWLR